MRLVKLVLLAIIAVPALAHALAFPSAVGVGRNTAGGRGGTVIKVTNLNDSGTGSLRAALAASGPRIIIFTVSGNIDLTSILTVTNPYVTIAGQTSPGGIAVSGKQFNIGTHDVIVRHMRFRSGGHRYIGEDSDGDSFSLWGPGWTSGVLVYNIIVDHCSMTWGTDETFSVTGGATEVTIQNTLIGQGLQYAKNGSPNQHSKGLMLSGKVNGGSIGYDTEISLYRNYLAHNEDRNPMIYNPIDLNSNMVIEAVNNVAYNVKIRPEVSGDAHVNWVGNYFRNGAWTSAWPFILQSSYDGLASEEMIFMDANLGVNVNGTLFKDTSPPDWLVTYGYDSKQGEHALHPSNGDPLPAATYEHTTPWPMTDALTATTMNATLAAEIVANAGATVPQLDGVDAAIVASYNGGGTDLRLETVTYPGSWPTYVTTGDNPTDTDGDGIPDAWESANGTNSAVADADANTLDATYTNVEMWINSLAGDTVGLVNGVCGTASGSAVTSIPTVNLCVSGTATAVSGSGPWTWGCTGSGGGTSTAADACTASLVADVTPPVTTSNRAAGRYTAKQAVTLASEDGAAIRYCFGAGCVPTITYSAPVIVLKNLAYQVLRYSSTDAATNAETVKESAFRKQRRR